MAGSTAQRAEHLGRADFFQGFHGAGGDEAIVGPGRQLPERGYGTTLTAPAENPRRPHYGCRLGKMERGDEFVHEIGAGLPDCDVVTTMRTYGRRLRHCRPAVDAVECDH